MIAALSVLAIFLAATCVQAYAKALDRAATAESRADAVEKMLDDALTDLAAETQAHAVTKREKVEAQRDAADNLTSLRVVLAAHARDIVLDPLGTDLIPDEPLTLVKGGRR